MAAMTTNVQRVALITGAGRGIGRAHALTLSAKGFAVVVNDIGAALDGTGRDDSPARQVVAEIEAAGGRAVADPTDVGSVAGGRAAVAAAIERFGRIDVVVNNAGFAHGGGDLGAPDQDELEALIGVHFMAAVGTMSAAIADMRTRHWGRIVNTVSEVALDTRMPGSLGYGAAKAAVWSATITAARDASQYGITVNAVSPGARTRMNADLLGALGSATIDLDPRHVAAVVAHLVAEEAGDITGRIIHAAGGELREYTTNRSSRTELVARLDAALG
ncbi:MAG: putative short-chain type dehydrogenase/reductase [Ilumatobacteraceae bacterium]|nr:putative short-chain type dehydrogenase/reductase [Ilumatobacteraceae bacterium]MCU1389918.1 putative short-chain type dehydrogenase/reductase [Ilumatobacteraceae bacterium]